MDALAFLDLVLPSESDGLRCVFVKEHGKRGRNYFFATNTELAAFILEQDAAGCTPYHACASYRDNSGRLAAPDRKTNRAANVHSVASLWSDIDAGPGKPYPDIQAAAVALAAACSAAALPPPVYVCSGRGLHPYWPLQQALPPELWQRYATGLKNAFKRIGFHADPTRTADAASILRTPGTTNRKDGGSAPVYVMEGGATEPYDNQLFDHLLKEAPDEKVANTLGPTPSWLQGRVIPVHLSSLATYIGQRPTTSAEPIAGRCGQMARFRDWRIHQSLPEPVWYALLGVLAFASDGDALAHRWSAGHNAYQPEQTQERLDRTRGKLTGATTCAHLHGHEPRICEACPHWGKIKSPIALGLERQDPQRSVAAATAPQAAPGQVYTLTPQTGTSAGLPPQKPPFGWDNGKLVFLADKLGGTDNKIVSEHPIFLHGVYEGETRGDFTLAFKQFLPAKGWFAISMPVKTLLGASGLADLASHGANITDGPLFLRYVRHAVDDFHHKKKLELAYEQYGWKADNTAFLFGAQLYTSGNVTEANVSTELSIRNKWIGPGCNVKGDAAAYGLERWKQAANSLFAAGCEAQSIALLASFAAPLMRFITTDEGGAILSLVTRASGTGKTVALAGASSVWGDRRGLSLTNEDNRVTKWLTLGALGNLPIVYDELQTRDPEALRDFVINFTNGRDKMRATREGQIRHSTSTWQTLLITASNSSLVDALSTSSQSDAPSLRVIELPLEIPAGLVHQIGDKLKNELIANSGYAGEVYADYLVQPGVVEFIKHSLVKYTADIYARTQCKNEHRFWVRATACITVAAMLVNELQLVEFSSDRIIDWLTNAITPEDSPMKQKKDWYVEALSEFMAIEGANFLVLPNAWRPGIGLMRPLREPRAVIAGLYTIADRRLSINYAKLRAFAVEHEIPIRDWLSTLQARGAVGEPMRRNLCQGTEIPGAQMNVVDIDLSHPSLAGVDPGFAVGPGDDTTNVRPMVRR